MEEEILYRHRQEGIIWNFFSTLTTAASSVLLLMIIERSAGIELGAYYSVAVAVANVLINIGHLNSFGYQISDVLEKYSFSVYLALRRITVGIMLFTSLIWICVKRYPLQKSVIILLYCIYRAVYAYADVYQGRYQQKGRVDLASKLQFIKVLIPDSILAVTVIWSHNVWPAIGIAMLAEMLCLSAFNGRHRSYWECSGDCPLRFIPALRSPTVFHQRAVKITDCFYLFAQCFPLFFSAFTVTYILNSSKYAIDRILNNELQVYYSILLLPATTVHMIAGFIYRPFLTEFAEKWISGAVVWFRRQVRKIFLIMASGIIFMEVLSGLVLRLLIWLYGIPELNDYLREFRILLLAGALNAAVTFLGFVITIMRLQNHMYWIYSITFLMALFLPTVFTERYHFTGAALSFFVLITVQLLLISMVYLYGILRKKFTKT